MRIFYTFLIIFISIPLFAEEISIPEETPSGNRDDSICVFTQIPDIEYREAKRINVGKGSFGSTDSIIPKFIKAAYKVGGNTVIDYYPRQRFGFWPWRIVRPVISGTVVHWHQKTNEKCARLGGSLYRINAPGSVYEIRPSLENTTRDQSDGYYEELKKLNELYQNKIITEAEFKELKKKVIDKQ